jgi:hypothetical protein
MGAVNEGVLPKRVFLIAPGEEPWDLQAFISDAIFFPEMVGIDGLASPFG